MRTLPTGLGRGNMMKYYARTSVSVLCGALMLSAVAHAADCRIGGEDAISAARSSGYSFMFSKIDGTGQCDEGHADPWFLASAAVGEDLICSATLFGGRGLNAPWHFVRVDMQSAGVDGLMLPAHGGMSLKIQFKLHASNGEDNQVFLTDIVLSGPACDSWQDAFN
jgi:hypothetical protein